MSQINAVEIPIVNSPYDAPAQQKHSPLPRRDMRALGESRLKPYRRQCCS